ncbi:Peroxidasin-like [Oryzias melastigma]|uniref:Peroxidasin-like n=1 Tax=Oryzias melastigma TaxID=30732 RepID=A0A834C314_ORYME|nr:Peroxidasin-like [Oryzias melastigma]
MAEDLIPGSRLGPTLTCLLATQFKLVRNGDRLQNQGQFNALSYHFRGRRSAEHSYRGEKPSNSIQGKSSVEDARLSLKNVTVTSKKSTESSVGDFQDFVSDMQKTITSLRKQIKRLESRLSRTDCTDKEGHERRDGERWKDDSCSTCECREAQVTCFVESCPPVTCKKPIKVKGACCPICIQEAKRKIELQ